jgi:hypothetical protein
LAVAFAVAEGTGEVVGAAGTGETAAWTLPGDGAGDGFGAGVGAGPLVDDGAAVGDPAGVGEAAAVGDPLGVGLYATPASGGAAVGAAKVGGATGVGRPVSDVTALIVPWPGRSEALNTQAFPKKRTAPTTSNKSKATKKIAACPTSSRV